MKGLDLAEAYYRDIAREPLRERFPELAPRLAVGLAGEGSECLGYDDEVSRDHDFGPSFCIWMTEADYQQYGEAVDRFYRELPGEYLGVPARKVMPMGRDRVGVMTTGAFYRKFTGCEGLVKGDRNWLRIPEHLLAQAVNGRVFEDPLGDFTRIREGYQAFYPEEVRRKKLAARAVTMAQSGQYNYPRMMNRGDEEAAALSMGEFLRAAISMAHLLCRRYTPYYKWMFRSFSELGEFAEVCDSLRLMARQPVNPVNEDRIERICHHVLKLWRAQGLTSLDESFLEPQGWELYRQIRSPELRALHILDG